MNEKHPTEAASASTGKSSALLRAREMPGFSLGGDRIDVRGWQVYANDMALVGTVDSLFVDMHAKTIRYLGVALINPKTNAPTGTVLVPVGAASRDGARRAIVLDALSSTQVTAAPRVPNRPVTRTDENAVLSVYGLPTWSDMPSRDLYHSPSFEERTLFGKIGAPG
jgi:hypothetical protein